MSFCDQGSAPRSTQASQGASAAWNSRMARAEALVALMADEGEGGGGLLAE